MPAAKGPLPGTPGAFRGGRTPDHERAARVGTTGNRRSRSKALEAVADRPQLAELSADGLAPPEHLSDQEAAMFVDLVAAYPPGLLSTVDRPALERAVSLAVERRHWSRLVAESGGLVTEPVRDRQGNEIGPRVRVHPAAALRACDRACEAVASSLAMTVAARARLGLQVSRTRQAEATTRQLLGPMGA